MFKNRTAHFDFCWQRGTRLKNCGPRAALHKQIRLKVSACVGWKAGPDWKQSAKSRPYVQGVGGGDAGCATAPPKVLICRKYVQNLWKSEQNP